MNCSRSCARRQARCSKSFSRRGSSRSSCCNSTSTTTWASWCTTAHGGVPSSCPWSSRYERRRDTRLGRRAHAPRGRAGDGSPPGRTAPRLRGIGTGVLPPARALGSRRRRADLARQARGSVAARGRPGRDCDRRPGERLWRATCSSSSLTSRRDARGTASRDRPSLWQWDDVLTRAGVHAAPHRVAQAYLELAVLVRALEGLADRARVGMPARPQLLVGRAVRSP